MQATIIDLHEFGKVRDRDLLGRIVATSGGFDPLHAGHATCIMDSKSHGDTLVVIVNGDSFLRAKKGRPFMDLRNRCIIVSCLKGVDYVVPFDAEKEKDSTVCEALRVIRPHVFTKGGDRTDYSNIPEWEVCQELSTELVPKVGLRKDWSSSDLLRDWGEYWKENH